MARKKRFTKQPSKFLEDAIETTTKVVSIEEYNKFINNRYKSVFYCESQKSDKPIMCVYWDRTTLEIGDTVRVIGRFNNNVFLAWQVQILKKAEQETEIQNG
ncbi:MAG: hypothetical protein J6V44_09100 [Methanobrevibacter sp.]|nr:hypothetical protein [Methanobrevibacter sp.]